MYEIGTPVYVKSLDRKGRVAERGWSQRYPRKAEYLIEWTDLGGGGDYLTGSKDLRRADHSCDGCGRWWGNNHFKVYSRIDDTFRFCFLCVQDEFRHG